MFPKRATSSRSLSTRNLVMSKEADALHLSSAILFSMERQAAIVCPITNTNRSIPFHLPVPSSSSLTGFIMIEQVKSVDYNARKARFVEKAPLQLVEDVIALDEVCIK
jgi:mRNA interferase MazF